MKHHYNLYHKRLTFLRYKKLLEIKNNKINNPIEKKNINWLFTERHKWSLKKRKKILIFRLWEMEIYYRDVISHLSNSKIKEKYIWWWGCGKTAFSDIAGENDKRYKSYAGKKLNKNISTWWSRIGWRVRIIRRHLNMYFILFWFLNHIHILLIWRKINVKR